MTQNITTDVVQPKIESRGIDAKTGVFGDHKVQFGKGLPIDLEKIKTPTLPFAGFKRLHTSTRRLQRSP